MSYEPKNYKTDGGDTLVIGGKLVVEDGATVEGLEGGGGGTVAWGDVTGKPATFPPTVGATATTAAAGNHTHTDYATSAALAALEARVTALEGAGG